MQRWRLMYTGPDFCRVGRRVAYSRFALKAFIAQQIGSRRAAESKGAR